MTARDKHPKAEAKVKEPGTALKIQSEGTASNVAPAAVGPLRIAGGSSDAF